MPLMYDINHILYGEHICRMNNVLKLQNSAFTTFVFVKVMFLQNFPPHSIP